METITKDLIQEKALSIIEENNHKGICEIDMGTGKTRIGIKAFMKKNAGNILITSSRVDLFESWLSELKILGIVPKYDIALPKTFITPNNTEISITLSSIQSSYKTLEKDLVNYDYVIVDEIHSSITPKHVQFLLKIIKFNIPILGLTGTLDAKHKLKADFYENNLPIIYSYKDAEKDKIINKKEILYLHYDLDDKNKIRIPSVYNKETLLLSERDAYNYYSYNIESNKNKIKKYYFNEIKGRLPILIAAYNLTQLEKDLALDTVSRDLDYFYKSIDAIYTKYKVSRDFYKFLKELKGYNYSVLGTDAIRHLNKIPKELKGSLFAYIKAVKERKLLLLNLESSKKIALDLKTFILSEIKDSKLLIFTSSIEKTNVFSQYTIHSKNDKNYNTQVLNDFNLGIIRDIASVDKLTLGINLKNTNFGILESYDGSQTKNRQKLARLNRLQNDKIAYAIVIVPKNTQSELWLKESGYDIMNAENVFNNTSEIKKYLSERIF